VNVCFFIFFILKLKKNAIYVVIVISENIPESTSVGGGQPHPQSSRLLPTSSPFGPRTGHHQ